MDLIPSVDILNGKVVRLRRGDPNQATVYSHEPVETARAWKEKGFHILHVVDLDAALGRGENLRMVEKIVSESGVRVQAGGGVRSRGTAARLLEIGASRVVIGTMAYGDPRTIEELISSYGRERIMVAVDYEGSTVRVSGWTRDAGMKVADALRSFRGIGAELFLMTAVKRDGMMVGPDVGTLSAVVKAGEGGKIYASGGVRSLEDLEALRDVGVSGVVVGRALYDGRIDHTRALRMVNP